MRYAVSFVSSGSSFWIFGSAEAEGSAIPLMSYARKMCGVTCAKMNGFTYILCQSLFFECGEGGEGSSSL